MSEVLQVTKPCNKCFRMQSCTTNVHIGDAAVAVTWNKFVAVTWNKFIAVDDDIWINSDTGLETILLSWQGIGLNWI